MEIQFTHTDRKYGNGLSALFLAAIICNVLAALDWLHLIPASLPGLLIPLLPPLIPVRRRKTTNCILIGILSAYLLIRFPSVLNGMKLLANQMFSQSEQTQAYAYDYFTVRGKGAAEAVLWLSVLAGFLCSLWGNTYSAVLCGAWIAAMAYFGVTPGAFWLTALLLAGLWNVLPLQQRRFHGTVVTVLVTAVFLTVMGLAPNPSNEISALDEQLRDFLAAAPITNEQTPVPTDVPEPEIIPPPDTLQEHPDYGVQPAMVNILFILLAALTLMLLFIPAVIKDRAARRREKNRSGIHAEDHGQAIQAMYLYAQRWRKLSDASCRIPADVYAVWQEAAYSDHAMSEAQRETVHAYMKETAEKVWSEADWKQRLRIRYRIAL